MVNDLLHVIQFQDRNVSVKDYRHLNEEQLLVTSVFYTFQGEGPFSGLPAVFIRLAGCNRGNKTSCPWCDTNFLFDKGKIRNIDSLIDEVWKHKVAQSLDKPIVVVTGGEPLLQSESLHLFVMRIVEKYNLTVQIESNGDMLRHDSVPRAVVVVSPKVSMRVKRYTRPHPEMLTRADYLKFVVDGDPDSPYHKLPDYAWQFADLKGSDRIYISPVSKYIRPLHEGEMPNMWSDLYDKEIAKRNHAYAAQLVMEYGLRLSLQSHLFCNVE